MSDLGSTVEKSSDQNLLKKICERIKIEKKITNDHINQLSKVFGLRINKAWEALKDGRIKKYVFKPSGRVVWIVVGKQKDYLVMPKAEFCSCNDFYYKFDENHLCYHIIAQKLAEAVDRFDLIEDDDHFYDVLIEEWKVT